VKQWYELRLCRNNTARNSSSYIILGKRAPAHELCGLRQADVLGHRAQHPEAGRQNRRVAVSGCRELLAQVRRQVSWSIAAGV